MDRLGNRYYAGQTYNHTPITTEILLAWMKQLGFNAQETPTERKGRSCVWNPCQKIAIAGGNGTVELFNYL